MKKSMILIGCTWILVSTPAFAKTGNEWRAMHEYARLGYVWGVVDMWSNLDQIKDETQEISVAVLLHTNLMPCLRKMTYGQANAIVEKYMPLAGSGRGPRPATIPIES
jgi:hypothetical protein